MDKAAFLQRCGELEALIEYCTREMNDICDSCPDWTGRHGHWWPNDPDTCSLDDCPRTDTYGELEDERRNAQNELEELQAYAWERFMTDRQREDGYLILPDRGD